MAIDLLKSPTFNGGARFAVSQMQKNGKSDVSYVRHFKRKSQLDDFATMMIGEHWEDGAQVLGFNVGQPYTVNELSWCDFDRACRDYIINEATQNPKDTLLSIIKGKRGSK